MKIAICQLDPIIGAFGQNTKKIIDAIKKAQFSKAHLAVFPELSICGYIPEDLLLMSDFIEQCEKHLFEIVRSTKDIGVILGLPRKHPGKGKPLHNSACVIFDGKILGYQDKMLLPTYDIFDESRYFEPAQEQHVFPIEGKRIGVTICEDIWAECDAFCENRYHTRPLEFFQNKNLDLMVNISASPYSLGKRSTRRNLALTCAKSLNCPTVLCNQVGGQDGLLFDGTSIYASPDPKNSVELKSFEKDFVVIDTEDVTPREIEVFIPEKELYSALTMGISDYFKKQNFSKAIIGLSGGIDSTLVACLAVHALGKENVLGVHMPSQFTQKESTHDAIELAHRLDIKLITIPITSSFDVMHNELSQVVDTSTFCTMEENLQARIRGVMLLSIANKEGYLVLNTSNKSELAVGYSTLYGDSCGAISVLGDLLKHQIYSLSRWINTQETLIPKNVLEKEPTAELRLNQKDTDSLPPYDILDKIVEEYVVFQRDLNDIAFRTGFDKKVIQDTIHKIQINEYKRRQCPLSLRVSDKAFSSGRKIPIVHRYQ